MENQITTMQAFDDLLSSINPAGNATPAAPVETPAPVEQPQQTDPTPAPADPAAANGSPTQTPTEQEPKQGDVAAANRAFAQMRVQNKKQADALTKVLEKLGVDTSLANDPDKILQVIGDVDTKAQAKQMNVDPAVLQRLNQLEQYIAQTNAAQRYNDAMTGFEAVKSKFSLNDTDIYTFATQLQEQGINPFEQAVDLEREYKLLNFDKVLEAERQKAIAEALANQNKAAAHSTTPSRTQSKPVEATPGAKINTMAQFDSFLMSLRK